MTGGKAVVIGDGGWGTALAMLLNANGLDVQVWGPFEDALSQVRKRGENVSFLPGVPVPPAIGWTSDAASAAQDADLGVLAVPTRYYRTVMETFAGKIPDGCRLVSVAKGLDRTTHQRMTEVACEVLGRSRVAALSGPSHAEEVAHRIPTAVTVASRDRELNRVVQDTFTNDHFRVYTSEDVVGVELGGALKNVIAIAVGVSDGLGFGDNTRAALITRGLAEITRLGCTLGARPATFAGLSGMGDLIVTCTSRHSRNRAVGERLGKGEAIADILSGMKQVAEGVWNCTIARELADAHGIDMPITDEVCAVVHDGKNPAEAVGNLMARDLKDE